MGRGNASAAGRPGDLEGSSDRVDSLVSGGRPYQDMMGPFTSVLAHSWAGIAAKYELDIPTARREFREAFEIGTRVG